MSAGRSVTWTLAGSIGVVSGWIMAGILEPITFGVFVSSVVGGLGVTLGVGAAFGKKTKNHVAALMDTISRTVASMSEWPEAAAGDSRDSGAEEHIGEMGAESAKNIERLEALQNRREALGPRGMLRRITYSIAVGASLGGLLPIALRFTPAEYPLPWIVVVGLGWILFRTVRSLFRGIRERRSLDAEIQTLLPSTDDPSRGLIAGRSS